MIRGHVLAAVMTLASSVALLGACNGNAVKPPDTPNPQPTGTATGETPEPTPDPTPDPTPQPAQTKLTESTPVSPSKMLADVEKTGIDMKKLPKLEDIPLAQKKKLMPLFQKSLGYEACTGCHVEGDFKKETKNIKMARGMWNHYVSELRMADGSALFCDSCHNGNEHVLVRDDNDALQAFMEANYEKKLSRADGEEHGCTTCHGDAFETKIFAKLWNISE